MFVRRQRLVADYRGAVLAYERRKKSASPVANAMSILNVKSGNGGFSFFSTSPSFPSHVTCLKNGGLRLK